MNQHDDIYLIDLWRILRREWRWALAALVVVLGLTFAFTRLAKPQWEATAWIQVGEIGPTPAGRDPKVEPFQRVIDRIKTRLFQDAVLRKAGLPLNSRAAQLYRGSLKPDPDPYANLIGVTIRAESSAQARRLAMATVTELQTLHGQTNAVALELARTRLQGLNEDLRAALVNRAQLQQQVQAGQGGAAATPAQVVAGVLLTDSNTTIRALKAERDDLIARLTTRYTYQTSLAWPLYVPDRQAFPNAITAWAAGLLAGAGLGVLAAVFRNAWRRRRVAAGHSVA
ncbi:Wzz/FepE/Etk N-terminal domain-containing protein [Xanthomonas hortorum pv. vitians]|uniref:Wzz/FepE/Etk N-terminal domain-containing protein n=1 Tax=Xanthomonas hortorum pv. vitians TaxID=83224 RepID=A0A6V7EGG2_9XANT|nr:Wzz/FepE/Etk N-terminal domain-containing protein [Xanthomonas hortorum]APP86997.1 chain-length determining protein [Xanthomonas hortorum pv. gardneri]ASW44860.1 chain-length determining protein [Xanthomonas hortorum]MCC8492938.1 chain-length determining protein [Xanthomonas hortorum pv. gardneri]MCE4282108.1 Wzz/FepE/Etk N-terminal domain-containing protein [Xanthomonas hortorum pv. vitians]MCE4287271.1 Wzz/FepE/Etk N-terminal domain-containing protein [Xanthomonas hortorum pv. vitians]